MPEMIMELKILRSLPCSDMFTRRNVHHRVAIPAVLTAWEHRLYPSLGVSAALSSPEGLREKPVALIRGTRLQVAPVIAMVTCGRQETGKWEHRV